MKMLTIICREEFKDAVLVIFASQEIKGYTVMREVEGGGITGTVPGTGLWRARTCCFLSPSTMVGWPHW